MFDIGWTELVVIAVVAIVVIGPKDLPRAMRFVGNWTGKMKRMAREFQGQFNEALREAELDSVRKDVELIGKLDPLAGVRKELSGVDSAMRSTGNKPTAAQVAAAATAGAPKPVVAPVTPVPTIEPVPVAAPPPVEKAAS